MSTKKWHYGWMILATTFLALLMAQGVRLSFGAFIQPWEVEFQTNRENISRLTLISYMIFAISQPLIGKIVDMYGVRKVLGFSILTVGLSTFLTGYVTSLWQLLLLYGVISSVGFGGASNIVATVAVNNWFKEKKGVALGISASASGAGQLLIVPASLIFIESTSWQYTVMLWGAILTFVVFPLVLWLIRSYPADKGLLAYGEKILVEKDGVPSGKGTDSSHLGNDSPGSISSSDSSGILDVSDVSKEAAPPVSSSTPETPGFLSILQQREFWFLLIPFFVCGVSTTGLMDTHLIPFAHDHGYSTTVTGLAVSLLAGCNILGTVLSGFVADRWSNKNFLAILYGTRALSIVLLLLAGDPILLMTFAVIFGLVDFATVSPTIMLASEYFKKATGTVVGWLYLSHQIGSALGSYLPGVIYRLTGGYEVAFIGTIALLIVAAGICYSLPETRKPSAPKGAADTSSAAG
ncbi:MFS transporter [Brevibacillus dissolubilis]|uniref:MFS transporter n=1 Tax=Brevibacillus dissolubilis TaxID=1844116 RepID=UPI0021005B2D|nr:MFS transporter [Brevibacillus dissolubilis]